MTLGFTPMLADGYGRVARTLRISVTDRCPFRCVYCMPRHPEWLPRAQILSLEEIARLARLAVECGIRKIRLTGGEPLVRRGVSGLVRRLAALPELHELAMTTNGHRLSEHAQELADAGLASLNISLDTLDRDHFRRIARFDGLERTLGGIDVARRIGFRSVKLNTVVIRGLNEDEIPALCRLGRDSGLAVRFIEFMPADGDRTWMPGLVVQEREILERASTVAPLVPIDDEDDEGRARPSRRFRFADGVGEIGVIASVSRPFCGACDRIRLTADGHLRSCLFASEETDLRTPLRGGACDGQLRALLGEAVRVKAWGHGIDSASFLPPRRAMNTIGG